MREPIRGVNQVMVGLRVKVLFDVALIDDKAFPWFLTLTSSFCGTPVYGKINKNHCYLV